MIYLLRNYFRFLDNIFHKWLENFDIKQFCDLYLNFPAEFPGHSIIIAGNALVFDIYYKPANSFNYLTYSSCHPSHTKNNIALSLAKQIINIVTDDRVKRLSELRKHLLERNHAPEIINYAFT